jgi:RNA methyltransferase, TrmH family
MKSITSPSNAKFKIVRSLHTRTNILKHRLCLLEGARFASEVLSSGIVQWIFISRDSSVLSKQVAEQAESIGIESFELPDKLFRQISDTQNPQGIVTIAELPPSNPENISRNGVVLLLDGVSDPGNMGAIIRSAAAFGVDAVLTSIGSCFPFIPKVTRSAAGTNMRMDVAYDVDLAGFMSGNRSQVRFIGADMKGDDLSVLKEPAECLGIVIGSEAHGISREVSGLLHGTVAVPMKGDVESLNAAVSASIILYEAAGHR